MLSLLLLAVGLTACGGSTSGPTGSSVTAVGRLLVQLSDGYIVGERRTLPAETSAVPTPQAARSVSGRPEAFSVTESAWREWIVGVFPGTPAEEVSAWIAPFGARVVRPLAGLDAYLIAFDRPRALGDPDIDRLLYDHQDVRYIDPNVTFTVQAWGEEPNDPHFRDQYNLRLIEAPAAWAQFQTKGGAVREVRVAVIDSGVCPDHPDLPGRSRWWADSFVDGVTDPYECTSDSHGTQVASVLAAFTNNGIGIAGTFWDPTDFASGNGQLSLASARALFRGGGSLEAVADALGTLRTEFAPDVINMSFGSGINSDLLREQVELAASAGTLIVAAAGNIGSSSCGGICYPAAYPEVIAVGSVDSNGYRSSFSEQGPQLDLVAPGRWVPVADVDGGGSPFYPMRQGTSFAAPAVAGVAAMLMASGLDDPEAVRAVLLFTARSTGPYDKERGPDPGYGWGLLDAHAALALGNRPEVFLARKVANSYERIGPVVYPSPNGHFELTASVPPGESLFIVGWVDSDRNGSLSFGDYFGVREIVPPGGKVADIVATPYDGF